MDERNDPIDRFSQGFNPTPLGRVFDWTLAYLFAQAAWVFVGFIAILNNRQYVVMMAPFAVFWIIGMVFVIISDEMRNRLLAGALVMGFASIIPCLPIGVGLFIKMEFVDTRRWDPMHLELLNASLIANINALLILIIGHAFEVIRRKRAKTLLMGDR